MRIFCVGGPSIPHLLGKAGHTTVDEKQSADLSVYVEWHDEGEVMLDSVDSELERNVLNGIAQVCHSRILIDRPGPNRSERDIVVKVPNSYTIERVRQVELGIVRGLCLTDQARRDPKPEPPPEVFGKRPFYKEWWFPLLVAVVIALIAAAVGRAQSINTNVNITRIGGVAVNGASGLLVSCPTCPAGAGGTQYNNGAAAGGTQTGTLQLGFDGVNYRALLASAAGRLSIDCNSGCGGPSLFTDGATFTAGSTAVGNIGAVFDDALAALSSGKAAAPRITGYRAFHVNLRNNSGTEVGTAGAPLRFDPTGSTTQPISGTVTANAGTGTMAVSAASLPLPTGAATETTLSGMSAKLPSALVSGRLDVNVGNTPAVTQSGAWSMRSQDGAGNALASSTSTPAGTEQALVVRPIPSGTQTVSGTVTANVGTFPDNEPINVAQMNGVTVSMNNGTAGTGVQRVALASDNSAVANWGQGATGAAPPSGAVQAGGVASGATGGLLAGFTVCDSFANIQQTANAQIITGVSGRRIYVCSINLVTATAQNVAVVAGTGSVCGTSTVAVPGLAGGTTAATGWNLAANSGIAHGGGLGAIAKTTVNADNLCVLQSGSGQLSGGISYAIY